MTSERNGPASVAADDEPKIEVHNHDLASAIPAGKAEAQSAPSAIVTACRVLAERRRERRRP